jgi:hypothetical protein
MIHASKRRITCKDFEEFLEIVREDGIWRYPKSIDDFDYGCLVGSAVLETVVRGSKSVWAGQGSQHWVLTDARRCRPRMHRGQLGFFKVQGGRT